MLNTLCSGINVFSIYPRKLLCSEFQTTLSVNALSSFVNSPGDSAEAMHRKCGTLPFVQFKKREKHPWRSVNFSKVAGFSL